MVAENNLFSLSPPPTSPHTLLARIKTLVSNHNGIESFHMIHIMISYFSYKVISQTYLAYCPLFR